jgi:hypothetical protein
MGYGKIEGAEHLYTFKEFNHYELVRQPEVAYLACKVFK